MSSNIRLHQFASVLTSPVDLALKKNNQFIANCTTAQKIALVAAATFAFIVTLSLSYLVGKILLNKATPLAPCAHGVSHRPLTQGRTQAASLATLDPARPVAAPLATPAPARPLAVVPLATPAPARPLAAQESEDFTPAELINIYQLALQVIKQVSRLCKGNTARLKTLEDFDNAVKELEHNPKKAKWNQAIQPKLKWFERKFAGQQNPFIPLKNLVKP